MTHFATLSEATQWVESNAKRGNRVLWLIPSSEDYLLIMGAIMEFGNSWITQAKFYPFAGIEASYQNGGMLRVSTNTSQVSSATADVIFAPPSFPFDDWEILSNPDRGFVSWDESW